MKRKISSSKSMKFILAGLILPATNTFAQTTIGETSKAPAFLTDSNFYLVSISIFILLIVILALSKTIIGLTKVVSKVNRKSSATILLFLISSTAFSQAEVVAESKATELPDWLFNSNMYLFSLLFFILMLTVFVLYKVNMSLIKALNPELAKLKKQEKFTVAVEEKKTSFLRKVYLKMVDSVPVAQEKDITLDHNYDGIKELDNNLPPWWIYGFYVTIIFGVFYLMIYHVSGQGKLQAEEYQDELLLAEEQREERMKASANNVNEDNVVALLDAAEIEKGKETFLKLCSACHLANGGGQVGPNLTDEYWLHGGGIKNMFKVITYGVPNKGMISWKAQLSPKQMQQVASYILTLNGTKPEGAKEPQGDIWIEEKSTPTDSTGSIDTMIVASSDTLKN